MRPRRPGNSRREPRGAIALETAMTLLVFISLLMGVFECGRVLMYRHLLAHAARDAARQAVAGTPDRSLAELQAEASAGLAGFGNGTTTVSVYRANASGENQGLWSDAGFGEGIAVHLEMSIQPLVPGLSLLSSPIRVQATSIQRSEGE